MTQQCTALRQELKIVIILSLAVLCFVSKMMYDLATKDAFTIDIVCLHLLQAPINCSGRRLSTKLVCVHRLIVFSNGALWSSRSLQFTSTVSSLLCR